MLSNKKTIVWGAGMIDKDLPVDIQIGNIKAVRGPLTQNILNKKDLIVLYATATLLYFYHIITCLLSQRKNMRLVLSLTMQILIC